MTDTHRLGSDSNHLFGGHLLGKFTKKVVVPVVGLLFIASPGGSQSSSAPFQLEDLRSPDQFHGRGLNYVAKWIPTVTDSYSIVVYSGEEHRFWSVSSLASAGRPQIAGNGKVLVNRMMHYNESPNEYWVYDHTGRAVCSLRTNARIESSPDGGYFYTVNHVLSPSAPILYDSLLKQLERFEVNPSDPLGWNALVIGDSLYVLRWDDYLTLYRLPHLEQIDEWYVPLRDGPIALGPIAIGGSGTVCAFSDLSSIAVVDLVSGVWDRINGDKGARVGINERGDRVYTVRWTNDDVFVIRSYSFQDGSISNASQRITDEPDTVDPGIRHAVIDDVFISGTKLIVNYMAVKGHRTTQDTKLRALIVSLPLSAVSRVSAIEAPIWRGTDAPDVLYTLERSERQGLDVKRIDLEGKDK